MTEPDAHPVDYLPELALGVLSEAEAAPLRAHLASCDSCRDEYAEMERVARMLPLAAEEVAPDPELKEAVFRRIAAAPRQERAKITWLRPVAAIAAGIALLVAGTLAGLALSGGDDSDPRETRVVQAAAEGTLLVARGEQDGTSASLVRVPGEPDAFIWMEGLPALPEGKAYQAWFTEDGAVFEPSDVFTDASEGAWVEANAAIDGYAAMGLTIEDSGGADTPSTAPFVVVDLTKSVRAR